VPAIDSNGQTTIIRTYAFNKDVRRMSDRLEAEMARRGRIRYGRVGNSRFCWVTAEDVVTCFAAMVDEGNPPYELAFGGKGWRREDDE
jgi:hypothetical protein